MSFSSSSSSITFPCLDGHLNLIVHGPANRWIIVNQSSSKDSLALTGWIVFHHHRHQTLSPWPAAWCNYYRPSQTFICTLAVSIIAQFCWRGRRKVSTLYWFRRVKFITNFVHTFFHSGCNQCAINVVYIYSLVHVWFECGCKICEAMLLWFKNYVDCRKALKGSVSCRESTDSALIVTNINRCSVLKGSQRIVVGSWIKEG